MPPTEFKAELSRKAQLVSRTLKTLVDKRGQMNDDLKKAVEYTLYAQGKYIRSALTLWCCELISGHINHNAEIAAAAIEMVHTYSLIHDDLPAMDDDDMRRGQPACHKAFDEATAILTGDSLLTLAFEILAKEVDDPVVAVKLIGQLAESAGAAGMIAGQMADLKSESTRGTEDLLEYIHNNKTAKMFQCAAMCGAIAGGADTQQLRCLWEYGMKIGLGFQIADDILDICASSEHLGKTAGKDEKVSKCTYPAVIGLEKSKQLEKKLADEAILALESFGPEADILRQLPLVLLQRTK